MGKEALLPCSWKQRLGDATPSTCHVQWKTPTRTVFELRGRNKWQAEELRGRAEVPVDKLESGDCSLTISDVQSTDAGWYESFMVVDGTRRKSRVFIRSIRLSVQGQPSLWDLHFLCPSGSVSVGKRLRLISLLTFLFQATSPVSLTLQETTWCWTCSRLTPSRWSSRPGERQTTDVSARRRRRTNPQSQDSFSPEDEPCGDRLCAVCRGR